MLSHLEKAKPAKCVLNVDLEVDATIIPTIESEWYFTITADEEEEHF